jgi:hypothetical protein
MPRKQLTRSTLAGLAVQLRQKPNRVLKSLGSRRLNEGQPFDAILEYPLPVPIHPAEVTRPHISTRKLRNQTWH